MVVLSVVGSRRSTVHHTIVRFQTLVSVADQTSFWEASTATDLANRSLQYFKLILLQFNLISRTHGPPFGSIFTKTFQVVRWHISRGMSLADITETKLQSTKLVFTLVPVTHTGSRWELDHHPYMLSEGCKHREHPAFSRNIDVCKVCKHST